MTKNEKFKNSKWKIWAEKFKKAEKKIKIKKEKRVVLRKYNVRNYKSGKNSGMVGIRNYKSKKTNKKKSGWRAEKSIKKYHNFRKA